MSRPVAPSLPTEKQVRDIYEIVSSFRADARIVRIGPDGVTFEYNAQTITYSADRPFNGD